VSGLLKSALSQRVAGDRPSPARAGLVAAVAGGAAAVITYKLLRH
jgi:hypothetical protein